MRALLTKLVAGSMIAGAAVLVSACQSETTAVVNNTTTEIVPTENMGATDDMVTTIDAANGAGTMDANMSMDNTMMPEGNMSMGNAM